MNRALIFTACFLTFVRCYVISNDPYQLEIGRVQAEQYTKFYLFTSPSQTDGQKIDATNFQLSNFNATNPIRFIIHGWLNFHKIRSMMDIKDAYLKRGRFNVIMVDWSEVAFGTYEMVASYNPSVGQALGRFAQQLVQHYPAVTYDNMYLIGFSMGAHIAGFAGKLIHPEKFNTIFALDAAGPYFKSLGPNERLAHTDARYVESIHTNIKSEISLVLGYANPIGHASFYAAWGGIQPGCFIPTCSHFRSARYFAKSIDPKNEFVGVRCKNVEDIRNENCQRQNVTAMMGGEPSRSNHSGIFYLPVEPYSPYAAGHEGLQTE